MSCDLTYMWSLILKNDKNEFLFKKQTHKYPLLFIEIRLELRDQDGDEILKTGERGEHGMVSEKPPDMEDIAKKRILICKLQFVNQFPFLILSNIK